MKNNYDLIIIGGGPAGIAAGVYAARKQLKTLLITQDIGGQSIVSAEIENWIGEKSISGIDLAKKLKDHLNKYKDSIDIKLEQKVQKVTKNKNSDNYVFEVITENNETFKSKTVILASGARRRRLGIPGEDKFEGKGVSFCSTCDAPVFSGKEVAVIGGGNAGVETAIDLISYATKIYLLEFSDALRADPVSKKKIEENDKVSIILNAKASQVKGDKFVEGLIYKDSKDVEQELKVNGVFIEIGSVPNSEMVQDLVELDERKQVVVDLATAQTSEAGVFAAGDVTNDIYKQNNISAGSGSRATLSAYNYISKLK